MEDGVEEDYGEDTQASSALIENTMPEPPVPTTGRGRCRTTSARGRRNTAKPRGGRSKSAASSTRAGGSTRGRARRAPTTASESSAAPLTVNASPRGRHSVPAKPETAGEMVLEAITTDSESVIDMQAEQYISAILPDPSTTIYATGQTSGQSANAPCSSYSAGDGCEEKPPVMSSPRRPRGRQARSAPVRRRRRVAVDGDERVVREPLVGHWSSLLPVGTVVRRPSTKLVQLVAQAIHESPHRVLRVTHVYAALQSKYPYYKLLDKGGINSWKSSVRHALFQKWFVKVCPTSMCENVRHRSYFWGLNYYLRPREWVMPQLEPRAFSSPVQAKAGHRGDDVQPRKNTVALFAFQLEPEREISPPETKKPLGCKRRQTAARGSSDCAPSVPQPSVEEQAGPSSTYPLPHMNLWKMEYMETDAWPAASQAFVSPTESATTSAVPTMASLAPAYVPAAVDSFQSSWKADLPPLDQNEQQHMTWPEFPRTSQVSQKSWGEFMASAAGNRLWEMIRSVDIGCPAQPIDDKYKFSFVGESQSEHSHGATTYNASLAQPCDDNYNFKLAGEHSHGATTYGASGKFSPRSVLFSPTHFPQIASPPSYTDLPLSDAKPPLLSPKQQKNAVEPVAAVPLHCLDGLISGFGLPPVDYTDGVAVFVRTSLPVWKRLMRRWRRCVGKDVARRQRITAFTMFPMRWPKAEEYPTRRDNGDDTNGFDDELPL
ncbi:uncharacterized protein LOC142774263 [Rhipicephalus microplus]|uniref:uncharacterized protein LOC142774263 n=1 Tax=Rhipicephalus microplus TaxID=6941 RepID=UPI003F6AC3B1